MDVLHVLDQDRRPNNAAYPHRAVVQRKFYVQTQCVPVQVSTGRKMPRKTFNDYHFDSLYHLLRVSALFATTTFTPSRADEGMFRPAQIADTRLLVEFAVSLSPNLDFAHFLANQVEYMSRRAHLVYRAVEDAVDVLLARSTERVMFVGNGARGVDLRNASESPAGEGPVPMGTTVSQSWPREPVPAAVMAGIRPCLLSNINVYRRASELAVYDESGVNPSTWSASTESAMGLLLNFDVSAVADVKRLLNKYGGSDLVDMKLLTDASSMPCVYKLYAQLMIAAYAVKATKPTNATSSDPTFLLGRCVEVTGGVDTATGEDVPERVYYASTLEQLPGLLPFTILGREVTEGADDVREVFMGKLEFFAPTEPPGAPPRLGRRDFFNVMANYSDVVPTMREHTIARAQPTQRDGKDDIRWVKDVDWQRVKISSAEEINVVIASFLNIAHHTYVEANGPVSRFFKNQVPARWEPSSMPIHTGLDVELAYEDRTMSMRAFYTNPLVFRLVFTYMSTDKADQSTTGASHQHRLPPDSADYTAPVRDRTRFPPIQ